jgi:signal transduction histidine kinase
VQESRSVVDRIYEVLNARDAEALSEVIDEHVELVVSGHTLRGLPAVRDLIMDRARGRPGLRIEPRGPLTQAGDRIVTEFRVIDTTEPTPHGTTKCAGSAFCWLRLDRIVECRVYLDAPVREEVAAAFTAVVAEQSALRRVAELVAQQAPPGQVFSLVTEQLGRLLDVKMARTLRFEPDGSVTVVAAYGIVADQIPPGTNVPIPEGSLIEQVFRTRRPARLDDYEEVGGPVGEILRQQGARHGVGGPIVVDGQLWGAMVVASQTDDRLPAGSEDRVAQFASLVSTAISNVESRTRVERLAAEQSALRRVAETVARQAPAEQVFILVTEELNTLLGVELMARTVRFEPDGTATVLGAHGMPKNVLPAGTNFPLPEGGILDQVFRSGRPGRVDDYSTIRDPVSTALQAESIRSAAAGPIVVDGRTWGAMAVASESPLPPRSENRLAQFAELVSTAISNIESRARVERLAAEQSALRRVAILVAREHSPGELLATLTEEIGVLLEVDAAAILRYEQDVSATVVAGWSNGEITLPVGERLPLQGENLADRVHRTGAPSRKDDYTDATGPIATVVRGLGIRSAVASPIVVEGATWGVVGVLSRRAQPMAADTEARLAEFSQVAGMAVANAKSRSDLAQSRARIVRAGDEARRRFERDLHDGAQQRLVSLGFQLQAAEESLSPDTNDLGRTLSDLRAEVGNVLDDLRELSRGLHPAVLSEGGLTPALRALARRSAVPVELRLELNGERFEDSVEAAAYFVASEALTNSAKHARASRVEVRIGRSGSSLELHVADDGRGGADASKGSGLTGLVDRVDAIGGSIRIESPPGSGTTIHAKLPIDPNAGGIE